MPRRMDAYSMYYNYIRIHYGAMEQASNKYLR